jgi:hypothetical protein
MKTPAQIDAERARKCRHVDCGKAFSAHDHRPAGTHVVQGIKCARVKSFCHRRPHPRDKQEFSATNVAN